MSRSSDNPYYLPDEDDDILKPHKKSIPIDGRKHVLDGSICPCGTSHDLNLPQDIPPEVLDQLSDFLDKLPNRAIDIVISSENSLAMKLLHDFIDFADEIESMNKGMPLIRALAEIVDRLDGGGVVGPLVRFYESEQILIGTHIVVKSLSQLKVSLGEKLDTDSEENTKNISLFDALEAITEASVIRLDNAIQKYIEIAKETENKIDQSIVESGIYSDDASYFANRLFKFPILNFNGEGDEEGKDSSQ